MIKNIVLWTLPNLEGFLLNFLNTQCRRLRFFQAPPALADFFERKILPDPPWALVGSRGLSWNLAGLGSRGPRAKAKAKGKAKAKLRLTLKLKLS